MVDVRPTAPTDQGSDQRGYVYFFGSAEGQRVKIGYSTNPPKRMRQLTDKLHFFAAVPGSREQEQALHAYFAPYRDDTTEWFWWRGEVRDFVEHITRQPWAAQLNDPDELSAAWAPEDWLPWMQPTPREYDAQTVLPYPGFDWTPLENDKVVSDEYFTRASEIALVRDVLGDIELDPASHPIANKTVQAERFFTIRDNGLTLPWKARTVYLNPPFSRAGAFGLKLHGHHQSGDVGSAIALVGARAVCTNWFEPLWIYPLCFTRGRLKFDGANGRGENPDAGHVFIYMGPRVDLFTETFTQIGNVVQRIDKIHEGHRSGAGMA